MFDSLLLSSYHNAVTLWLGLEDTYYACVNLETFSAGKVLKRAESMVLGTLLQNKGETINTVAAVSSAFPAVPSSVTIYHGEATTLVGEEASTVYQLVANMVEHSTTLADRGQFGYGTVFEKLSGEYVIMELRYEQRQQYKNDAVMAASDTLTDDELFAVKASMTDGFTYDSVVFAISVKNNCIYMLPPFACIDGVYQVPSGSGTMMEWACSDQAIVSSIKEYCQ